MAEAQGQGRMHVAVLGAGGIGCWLAARLALAGQRTSLLARGASLAAIREHGLRAAAVDGSTIGTCGAPALSVHGAAEEVDAGVGVLFVAVKTHQLAACVPQVAALLRRSPSALVVPMANGVDAHDVIARGLEESGGSADGVMGGIARSVVYISHSGTVVLERELGVAVGPIRACAPTCAQLDALRAVSRLLTDVARVSCELIETADAMRTALWTKFLVTGCLGPFSAAARAPVDVLMSTAETTAVVRALMEEMRDVGAAGGVRMPDGAVEDALAICARSPPGTTFSTTRDVLGGRPSELLEFCGVVVRLGRERGVPTPSHAQLLATLLPQERVARGELAYELRGV
ncbi:hypothetical protein KFE25_014293 [Diacronema lutheri]|uniref:2-dehydropantoate 2-reductase n=1 Tax=Diacronema lutheri TaxID=2081491 RepID=A0A8J6CA61_DIALT|nr:hypothetical protein KFE25_014293 [Diacronema lutheri]